MAVKINNEIVVSDSKEFILDGVTFTDTSFQNTAVSGSADGEILVHSAGELVKRYTDRVYETTYAHSRFGQSIACSNRYIAVGDPMEHGAVPGGNGTLDISVGAVFIYDSITHKRLYAILSPDNTTSIADEGFGYRVAIKDDILVVANPENGVLYIYKLGRFDATLITRIRGTSTDTGRSGLAFNGTAIVATESSQTSSSGDCVRLYTLNDDYTINNETLLYGNSTDGDFGFSIGPGSVVDINDTYIAIGNPSKDYPSFLDIDGNSESGLNSGCVYLVKISHVDSGSVINVQESSSFPTEIIKVDNPRYSILELRNSSFILTEGFGSHVSLSDNGYLVVGSGSGNDTSSVSLFRMRLINNSSINNDKYQLVYTENYPWSSYVKLTRDGQDMIINETSTTIVAKVQDIVSLADLTLSSGWWVNDISSVSNSFSTSGIIRDTSDGYMYSSVIVDSITLNSEVFIYACKNIYDLYGIQSVNTNYGGFSSSDLVFGLYKKKFESTNSISFSYVNGQTEVTSAPYYLGTETLIHGEYTFISAYSVSNRGEIFIFNTATGQFIRKISSPNPVQNGFFGACMSASGKYLAIGEEAGPSDAGGLGRVYVYDIESDTIIREYHNPNLNFSSTDFYGSVSSGLSIDGDYLAVGASLESSNNGVVYVYQISAQYTSTTDFGEVIYSPYTTNPGYFGRTIKMSKGFIFISIPAAYGNIGYGVYPGAVCVYKLTSIFPVRNFASVHIGTLWNPNVLSLSSQTYSEEFGNSIDVSGDYVIVSAPKYNQSNQNGRVYVYDMKNCYGSLDEYASPAPVIQPSYTIDNPLPGSDSLKDMFGYRVAANSNYVVVGAPWQDYDGDFNTTIQDTGRIYVYDIRNGDWVHTFDPPNVSSLSALGWGTNFSVDEDYIIIGSRNDDTDGTNYGAAYQYSLRNMINLDKLIRRVS